jgi:acetyltransferase EpsM
MTYIYGASGHGKVIFDILNIQQVFEVEFVDDNRNGKLFSCPIRKLGDLRHKADDSWIIGIGDNKIRKQISQSLNVIYTSAIHPSATVSDYAKLGLGVVIMAGAIINASATIGSHVIVNTNCSIDHDSFIEDFVHIAPGAAICGNVHVGEGTLIGTGAAVIPGVVIGKNCVIGAGSVVINNIPDYSTVVGVPGGILKSKRGR